MAQQQLDAAYVGADSSKWVAKAWRSECGVTGLSMPAARCAFWQACSTASFEMCRAGGSPGNSQGFGRDAPVVPQDLSSFGESMT